MAKQNSKSEHANLPVAIPVALSAKTPGQKMDKQSPIPDPVVVIPQKKGLAMITGPTANFTQTLAHEIAKNLAAFGQITARPFKKAAMNKAEKAQAVGDNPVFVDTSVLIDGRILPIINSGFFAGTLVVPQIILEELQHIADSADMIRRTKGRRGMDIVAKLRNQKVNPMVKLKIIKEDPADIKEVDRKLAALTKKHKARMLTVDFNLAQLARAQGIKVLNIHDLAQAMKAALIPGEELNIRISHEGKEREQGVGYLEDGTMVVVDNTRDKVGHTVMTVITKIHQTPAGQLFFARLK